MSVGITHLTFYVLMRYLEQHDVAQHKFDTDIPGRPHNEVVGVNTTVKGAEDGM